MIRASPAAKSSRPSAMHVKLAERLATQPPKVLKKLVKHLATSNVSAFRVQGSHELYTFDVSKLDSKTVKWISTLLDFPEGRPRSESEIATEGAADAMASFLHAPIGSFAAAPAPAVIATAPDSVRGDDDGRRKKASSKKKRKWQYKVDDPDYVDGDSFVLEQAMRSGGPPATGAAPRTSQRTTLSSAEERRIAFEEEDALDSLNTLYNYVRKEGVSKQLIPLKNCPITVISDEALMENGGKRYRCDRVSCGKGFDYPITLIKHLRSHTHLTPLQCAECGKTFSHPSNLRTHVSRVHRKERPFECDVCHKRFTHGSTMRTHKLTQHSTEPFPFKCKDCSSQFKKPATLKRHRKEVHGASKKRKK